VALYPGEQLSHDEARAVALAIFDEWSAAGAKNFTALLSRVRTELLRGKPAGYRCKQAMLLFVRRCVQHALDAPKPREALKSLIALCKRLCAELVKPGESGDELLRPVEVTDGLLLVMDFWADVAVDVPLLHEYMGVVVGAGLAAGVVNFEVVQEGVAQATGGFAEAVVNGQVSKMLEVALRIAEAEGGKGTSIRSTKDLRLTIWCEDRRAATELNVKLEREGLIAPGAIGRR
jgi:hypothetical protein